MEVDWSKLPTELLNLISQRIYGEVDLIRFRSVCSTWRSSSSPNHHDILPFKFPLLKLPVLSDPNDVDTINNTTSFWYLCKQNIFLIKPPQEEEQTLTLHPWLISTSQNTSGQTKHSHPLPQYGTFNCNFVLDYNKLPVLHLGSTYFVLDYGLTVNKQLYSGEYMYPKKAIATMCHGKKSLIVGALASPPYSLLLKFGDENWKVIPDMSANFGDICLFKGRPYAVDKIGKTIMVGPDSSVQLVAEPLVGGGNVKFLVESEGNLLLVDVYDCRCLCIDPNNPGLNYHVRIDLFKLSEKEKKWVKLTSLGDRVLFLGLRLGSVCSFCASASDLGVTKGNCVIFVGNIFQSIKSYQTYVLDLDQGRLSLLSDYPEYSILFRPPHRWMDARYQVCYLASKGF